MADSEALAHPPVADSEALARPPVADSEALAHPPVADDLQVLAVVIITVHLSFLNIFIGI